MVGDLVGNDYSLATTIGKGWPVICVVHMRESHWKAGSVVTKVRSYWTIRWVPLVIDMCAIVATVSLAFVLPCRRPMVRCCTFTYGEYVKASTAIACGFAMYVNTCGGPSVTCASSALTLASCVVLCGVYTQAAVAFYGAGYGMLGAYAPHLPRPVFGARLWAWRWAAGVSNPETDRSSKQCMAEERKVVGALNSSTRESERV